MSPRPLKDIDLDHATFAGQVGAIIRKKRLAKKLSVEEACQRAGVPRPTWYHWEAGAIALDALPKAAKALGCSVRMLIPKQSAGRPGAAKRI